jgi:Sigma-70, region 4
MARSAANHGAALGEGAGREPGFTGGPVAEEIFERIELEKVLAELVAALPEAERQVVYLRYFEGCDSPEIARRLGCPEGTVRWRIKVAIQRLRTQLDDRFGERRHWSLVLLPLTQGPSTGEGVVPSARPSKLMFGAIAAAVAVAVAVSIFWAVIERRDVHPSALPAASGGSHLSPGTQRGGPPAVSLRAALPAAAGACPELAELRAELVLREREAITYARFESAFATSPPNPVAQRNIGAVLEQAFVRMDRCGHSVECRGLVCRVETLLPEGVHLDDCKTFAPDDRWGERRYRFGGQMSGGVTTEYDPLAKKHLLRYVDFYRLAAESGDPVPESSQRPPAGPRPARHVSWRCRRDSRKTVASRRHACNRPCKERGR